MDRLIVLIESGNKSVFRPLAEKKIGYRTACQIGRLLKRRPKSAGLKQCIPHCQNIVKVGPLIGSLQWQFAYQRGRLLQLISQAREPETQTAEMLSWVTQPGPTGPVELVNPPARFAKPKTVGQHCWSFDRSTETKKISPASKNGILTVQAMSQNRWTDRQIA